MKASLRRAALAKVLHEIASYFMKNGWELLETPRASAYMQQCHSADVVHTLLVHEPFNPRDLPAENVVGLSCAVNVFFPELEDFIHRALGRDPKSMGKVSARLPLNQLVPSDRLFAGNVHLIDIDVPDVRQAVGQFLSDFEEFLEPVRRRVSEATVLLDPSFTPPGVGIWSWILRQAAYYRLHTDLPMWLEFAAQQERAISEFLGPAAANDANGSRVFMDMHSLKRASAVRAAEEVRRFLSASHVLP